MKSKSMSDHNGSQHSHEETLTEYPSTSQQQRSKTQGPSQQQNFGQQQTDPQRLRGQQQGVVEQNFNHQGESNQDYFETEIEEIEGSTFIRPGEGDQQVDNSRETEATQSDQYNLEEVGSEKASEHQPMDALLASYSELIPSFKSSQSQMNEVIIGVDNRVRVNATALYPWSAVIALKITAKDNTKWIGTGWLVSPRTIITAGHCVFLHDHGGWAKSVEVIPGLNEVSRPFGSFTSSNLRSVNGWINSKNRDFDYGAIILPQNSRPGDRTGYFGFGVKTDPYLMQSVLNLSGYPGDKGGNQQWFMALKPKSVNSRVISYDIDTIGGQSGAPVWVKVGNTRTCVGIHTNGHLSGNSATRIVEPVFNNIQAWKNQGL